MGYIPNDPARTGFYVLLNRHFNIVAFMYPLGYPERMNSILRTENFDSWIRKLKDKKGKARIVERIRSAERGNFGDCSSVEQGVSEMRVHFGPGYRVYFTQIDDVVYVLLGGGSKGSQKRDVTNAQKLARSI